MLRLFAGLELPVLLRQRLTLMHGGIDGARWTERDNFHLTLTFIGNVDEAVAEAAHDALSSVHTEPFTLQVKGTGAFAKGKDVHVLWIGVEHNEVLFRLKDKIDRALQRAGVPFENRKYTPHITIARLQKSADEKEIARFMQEHNLFSGEFDVDTFTLFRTHQTKNGSMYEPVEQYPLLKKVV